MKDTDIQCYHCNEKKRFSLFSAKVFFGIAPFQINTRLHRMVLYMVSEYVAVIAAAFPLT